MTASWTGTAPCHSSSPLTAARPRDGALALGWAGFTYSSRRSGFRGLPRPRVVLFLFFKTKLLYDHCSSSSPTSASLIMRPLKPSVSSGQRACWKIRGPSFWLFYLSKECLRVTALLVIVCTALRIHLWVDLASRRVCEWMASEQGRVSTVAAMGETLIVIGENSYQ